MKTKLDRMTNIVSKSNACSRKGMADDGVSKDTSTLTLINARDLYISREQLYTCFTVYIFVDVLPSASISDYNI